MKRIALFCATNIAVLVVIGLITSVLGLNLQEGLEQYNDNTSLLYNRIMMNYQLNNLKDTLKDIEILIQYDDIDNEIFNQLCILKENILKK